MTTLTPDAMRTLHGARFWGPPRGAGCGLLVGLTFGLAFTGRLVAAEVPPVAVPLPMLDPEPSVVPGVGAS